MIMRKHFFITGFLMIFIGLSSFPQHLAAQTYFPDVPGDHDNTKAIMLLQQAGLFSGYPDGTFRPGQSINRAELLKILIMSIGSDAAGKPEPADCFPDVHAADWFSPYVCFAAAKLWVTGYPDGYFRPERMVSLVEALKMLSTVRQYNPDAFRRFPASGYPRGEWYSPYINIALNKDFVSLETIWGNDIWDGLDKPLTRMRGAEMLYRAMMDDGRVRFFFKTEACDLKKDVQKIHLRRYDAKYNNDGTVILDFDLIGKTADGKECPIAVHANPYAGVSRYWHSRTMFLVSADNHDDILEEAPVIDGNVYFRSGHETAGLSGSLWSFNVLTGSFAPFVSR